MRDTDRLYGELHYIDWSSWNQFRREVGIEDMQNTQKTAGFLGRRAEAPNLIFLYKKRFCAPKMLEFFCSRRNGARVSKGYLGGAR